jgi:hypothetical protein
MKMLKAMKPFVPEIGELLKKIDTQTQRRPITIPKNSPPKLHVPPSQIDVPSGPIRFRIE